ncbi:helix-turn-helix domain-containing protein [Rhizobium sp. CECT 9324]|uniref:helix-turn-helix domain-containing protein n=1 Tax=Rhizobium sp. CECT 9324 TaxID=2845820 RepID=UPI001E29D874|nr:helix-turn-helix domain-containing protein [Rhizobium sp. CECT 9324]CAH0338714.1 Transcriptional activatory protein AadR [Rhizobium sp. CECT 9324]
MLDPLPHSRASSTMVSMPPMGTAHQDTQRADRHSAARLPPRTTIFLEGFARSPLYRVIEGCVATSQALSDGRRQIIDIVGPGRVFGLGLGDRNHCSAETLGWTRLEPYGDCAGPLLEMALHEMLARSQALTMLLGRKTASERVAFAILDLAGQFGRPARQRKRGAVTFHLYPTRADLADWLGLTIETVSRCFTRLKRVGFIDFQTSDLVTLLEPASLARVAAGDGHLPLPSI